MLIHRNLAVPALVALALSACQQRTAPLTDADRNAISGGVADFDKAMLAGDWPKVVSFYTEDAMLLPPDAPVVQGRAAIRKFFEGFPKMSEFKQSVDETEGLQDLAYARGTFRTKATPPGAKAPVLDAGKVIAIWRKQPNGSWLVTRVIWNSDLPPGR